MAKEKFIGQTCMSCHNMFGKNDDIVVCPDCGTPYHRECYAKEGRCINDTLHENGEFWSPVIPEASKPSTDDIKSEGIQPEANGGSAENSVGSYQKEYANNICSACGSENPNNAEFCLKCGNDLKSREVEKSDKNVCPVCGLENKPSDVFCVRCGAPLDIEKASSGGSPFGIPRINRSSFRADSDIDGNTVEEYTKYIGKNWFGFLPKFLSFSRGGPKMSFNIGALFFPNLYFFYRKMNLVGAIVVVISVLLSIPTFIVTLVDGGLLAGNVLENATFQMISVVTSLMSTVLSFVCCFFADYMYYKKAQSDIKKIKETVLEEKAKNEAIIRKGGASWTGALVGVTAVILLASVMMFILMAFIV